jgi:hypothetical protein
MSRIANADAPEIEITPEVIERGVELLASYDPDHESDEEFVERFLRSFMLMSGITALAPKRSFHRS